MKKERKWIKRIKSKKMEIKTSKEELQGQRVNLGLMKRIRKEKKDKKEKMDKKERMNMGNSSI